jgi:hypothetical protein
VNGVLSSNDQQGGDDGDKRRSQKDQPLKYRHDIFSHQFTPVP